MTTKQMTDRKLSFLKRRIEETTGCVREELKREYNRLFFETPEGQQQIASDIGRIAQALKIGVQEVGT